MRSLDFTACCAECKTRCWRKLSREEVEWLENNPNRMSGADFSSDCKDYQPIGKSKGFDLSKITVADLFQMEDDFMELENE